MNGRNGKRRPGPSPEFVRDDDGREVFGLREFKSDRCDENGNAIYRYYSLDDAEQKVYHGDSTDKTHAIFAFHQWDAARSDAVVITQPVNVDDDRCVRRALQFYDDFVIELDGSVVAERPMPPEGIRGYLAADSAVAARDLRMPDLDRLRLLPEPTRLTLKHCGRLYLDRKKNAITPKEWGKAKTWWAEFCRAVAPVTIVRDLDFDAFDRYAQWAKDQARCISPRTGKSRGKCFTRNRFHMIRTILNFSHRCRKISAEDIARLKADWAEPLTAPKKRRRRKIEACSEAQNFGKCSPRRSKQAATSCVSTCHPSWRFQSAA